MEPNSPTPAPAAPAAEPIAPVTPAPAVAEPVAPAAPAAEPIAPVTPAPAVAEPLAPAAPAEPAPAPRTIDPVDHSVTLPANPVPAADPVPADPAPAVDPTAPVDTTAATLAGDIEDDELESQIKEAAEKSPSGTLPSGINPDGTVDPLLFAYENMPTIKIVGKIGAKGEVKEFTVKTAEDLPADFRFANDVDRMNASTALQQNINIANKLIDEANSHNEGRIAANERRQMMVAQKTEVDSLIASGKLPAITAKPTDPNFMQDPGAIRAQQVLDHMKEVNAANKAAGINQEITSVALGLQLLEAKEAIEGKNARMGTITDTRTNVNAKISGGGAASPDNGTTQTIHKDVSSALRNARRKYGL